MQGLGKQGLSQGARGNLSLLLQHPATKSQAGPDKSAESHGPAQKSWNAPVPSQSPPFALAGALGQKQAPRAGLES